MDTQGQWKLCVIFDIKADILTLHDFWPKHEGHFQWGEPSIVYQPEQTKDVSCVCLLSL